MSVVVDNQDFSRQTPTLVAAVPVRQGGRSRFVLAPLSLTLDQFLLLITAALLCMGLLMVLSADARVRTGAGGDGESWLLKVFQNKNAIHALAAMAVLTLIWRLDYRWLIGRSFWTSPALWLVAITILALLAVFAPGLGKQVNGARRWIVVGGGAFQFQPSELAKLALVAFIAMYGVHCQRDIRKFAKGFLPLMLIFGATLALVLVEDFGTTALVAVVSFVLLLMVGCRWWHVGLLIPPGVLAVWAMIFRDPTSWRYRRFMAFLDPAADAQGAGYHLIQSLGTICHGGFWGRGLGNGLMKMGYLPEDSTDFIFAVICEELGIVGAAMVVALFVTFVFIGWRIATRCQHPFGKMLAFGVTAIIGLQAAINIAVVTVTIPTKGIALPLISSGGTGWIMNAVAIGVLMSVERINRREKLEADRADRGAEPAFGFPVQVQAVPEAQ
ncbi:MAG: putative lipid II flippase FtsW [Phycisphaerales bacterium]|nr:putative lipid II flippase FtsW [Phycisphaerales bacterium]